MVKERHDIWRNLLIAILHHLSHTAVHRLGGLPRAFCHFSCFDHIHNQGNQAEQLDNKHNNLEHTGFHRNPPMVLSGKLTPARFFWLGFGHILIKRPEEGCHLFVIFQILDQVIRF